MHKTFFRKGTALFPSGNTEYALDFILAEVQNYVFCVLMM